MEVGEISDINSIFKYELLVTPLKELVTKKTS